MNKFSKSVVVGFIIALLISFTPVKQCENYLFSAFSMGWSSHTDDKSDEKIEIMDKDSDISYSFMLWDLISSLF